MVVTAVFGCYEHSIFGYEIEKVSHGEGGEAPADEEGDAEPLKLKQVFAYASHLGCVNALAASKNVLVSGGTDEAIKYVLINLVREHI